MIRGPAGARVRVWWLSPVLIAATVVPLSVALTLTLDDAVFRQEWRTPMALTTDTGLMFVSGALALALGAAVASFTGSRHPEEEVRRGFTPAQYALLRKATTVFFALTVLGYVAFVASAVLGGVTLADVVRSVTQQDLYDGSIKARVQPIAGLTTLTQLGVPTVVCAALLWFRRSDRRALVQLGVVLALALPRAYLFTERLAVLELLVPLAVVVAAEASRSPRGRRLVALTPAVAIPAVFGAFALFEYSRSWVYYRATTEGSFARFVLERVAGYYATAYNNGQLQLTWDVAAARWPRATMEAFWQAPGIEQAGLQTTLNGYEPVERSLEILALHGNPEFNNLGGIAEPFVDYGWMGGLVYFLVFGGLVGLAYRSMRRGSPAGTLLYPVLFLGLLEVPRYLYWAQGRATPALVALAVLAVLLHRAGTQPTVPFLPAAARSRA